MCVLIKLIGTINLIKEMAMNCILRKVMPLTFLKKIKNLFLTYTFFRNQLVSSMLKK